MHFLSKLISLIVIASLSACGGGGGAASGAVANDPSKALSTTAPALVNLQHGSAQTYTVSGGTGPYTAVSDNVAIAAPALEGNNLTIGAVAPGSATIVVRDARNATVSITARVTVSVLGTTAPSSLTLPLGAANAQTYVISGGVGPYTATSNNVSVAAAQVSGSSLTITGISGSSATILVRDAVGNTLTIGVTIASAVNVPLFTTAPSPLTVAVASSNLYGVGGGLAPYTATTSNAAVAVGSITGNTLTVNAVGTGSTSLVIRDAAGTTSTISVTVPPSQFMVSPSSATAFIGDTLTATISGGTGPYTVLVTNTAVASASVTGSVLTILVKQQAASVPVIITDSKGFSTNFTLTSGPGQPAIQMTPTALTVSELDNAAIELKVTGAVGAISAFSSDVGLLGTSVSGSTVTVTTGLNGSRCISTPAGGTYEVRISAIDSTGALATTAIQIQDSIGVCP